MNENDLLGISINVSRVPASIQVISHFSLENSR